MREEKRDKYGQRPTGCRSKRELRKYIQKRVLEQKREKESIDIDQ
jgi:hypothetical protein